MADRLEKLKCVIGGLEMAEQQQLQFCCRTFAWLLSRKKKKKKKREEKDEHVNVTLVLF